MSSSSDALKNHMHSAHRLLAVHLGVPLPSFKKTKPSSSTPPLSLSSPSHSFPLSGVSLSSLSQPVPLDQKRELRERVAAKEQRRSDPRVVWGLYLETAKELAACALALLELTCSEAAVERSFSRQGFVHSKLRNRLSNDSVYLQMSFAFNTRALNLADRIRPRTEEEAVEEIMDDDPVVPMSTGTSLLSRYSDDQLAAVDEEEEESKEDVLVARREEVEADSEEEQDEEKDEKEEEEEAVVDERTEEERLQELVEKFVADHRMTQITPWREAREGALQAAIISSGLRTLVSDMKARINRHLTSPPAPPPPDSE